MSTRGLVSILLCVGSAWTAACNPPLSQEGQNAAVFDRLLRAMAAGNLELFDELCAPRYEYHAAGSPAPLSCEEHKRAVRAFTAAFSAYEHHIEDIFPAGDKVAFRLTASGTHTGQYLGIAPTHREVRFRMIGVVQFVNGKILRVWIDMDWATLFQQIGTTPRTWHGRWAERLFQPLPPTPSPP